MKLKKKKTRETNYKTIYENKEQYKEYLFLHNLDFFNKIHIASSLLNQKC